MAMRESFKPRARSCLDWSWKGATFLTAMNRARCGLSVDWSVKGCLEFLRDSFPASVLAARTHLSELDGVENERSSWLHKN